MRKATFCSIVVATLLVCILPARPGLAAFKVWVSNAGADSVICGAIASPCATFQQAHDNVDAGGEIGVLNPGEYQSVMVTKSVFITNDGVGEAFVLTPGGGSGVVIVPGIGDIVGLRGLVIDGRGIGLAGLFIQTGTAVHTQNCVIRNFQQPGQGFGILLIPSFNTQLFVSDTMILNNGSVAASGGIKVEPFGGGIARVVLDRVHLENNVRGLWVNGAPSIGNANRIVIRDSVVSGNAAEGILATTTAGHAPALLVVERTAVVNNVGTGIRADGPGATMLLNNNTVVRNGVGLSAVNSGQLISYRNNRVNNNLGLDGTPTGSYGSL